MYSNNSLSFCLSIQAVKPKHRQHIKRNQIFFFIVWVCLGVQSMQKIASLYILVHIYIITTAFHSHVPCFCFCLSDLTQASEYIQWNAQDNTRETPRNTDSRHLQHTHQDSHIRNTAVIQSSIINSHSPPLGRIRELETEMSLVAHCTRVNCTHWSFFCVSLQQQHWAWKHFDWANLCQGCTTQYIELFSK